MRSNWSPAPAWPSGAAHERSEIDMRTPKSRLLGALPFAHECVWTIKYLLGEKVQPFGGRWKRLAAMLEQLDQARARGYRPERPRRLLVFGYHEFWINYLLPFAVVLAGREGSVDFL